MKLLNVKYKNKISGTLTCYDRITVSGNLTTLCYAQGMTGYLYSQGIKIFDYPKFAEPFRNQIRENAEKIAKDNNIEIEFVPNTDTRKESIIAKKIEQRGNQPGMVHVLSAMETCPTYKPWHDKTTGATYLRGTTSKCLTYYFYFINKVLGLCYVRVPTWLPCRLQIYFNGHNWLANKLQVAGLKYKMLDNAFIEISDWEKANEISQHLDIKELHQELNAFASKFCPVYKTFKQLYHWTIMQCECATDIVFKEMKDLQAIYSQLVSTAIHTVKPDNIVTFLGKKLNPLYQGEVGNNYHLRIEGTRIKHNMQKNSIKMYDKYGTILRIETATSDVSFFKHFREVVHRDGTRTEKDAPMQKTIYSLTPLQAILQAANRRYLEFISAIEDQKVGREKLNQITTKTIKENRTYRGFNFFDKNDEQLLQTIARGEFNIYGFRSKHFKQFINKNSSQISRIIKRLHVHGLIKKVRNTYKYYLTQLGKQVILMGEKLINLVIIPELNYCIAK